MPIYEYVCKQCGKPTDILQKMNDPAPESCPSCGAKGPLERMISRTSFVLKGGGWYSDLYGSSKKEAKKEGGAESSSGSGDKAASSSSSGSGSGDKAAPPSSSGTASSSSPAPSAPAAPAS